MPKIYAKLLLPLLFLLAYQSKSQHFEKIKVYDKEFQFSLFPGVSSNGIETWKFNNKYALNIFGGLSAGNQYLEIGGTSNINLYGSTGIQIAGLANIVGANAFANLTNRERKAAIKEGFEANTTSIQVSGLLNFTRNNATGIQATGGMNIVGNNMTGMQIALIGNGVGEETQGIQLAGLYNISSKSTKGIQISALYNFTKYSLTGIQLGLFNTAKTVTGKKSVYSKANSIQIGLVNKSKKMTGIQIGLINIGGKTLGTQVGLINFFRDEPNKEQTKNGTPIGLINIGSIGPLRASINELFLINLEIATGNCSNCTSTQSQMPFEDNNKKFNQNSIIIGVNQIEETWGFGYGFQKMLLNKYDMTSNPKNAKRMLSYGVQLLHLNSSNQVEKSFNLLTKLHFEVGKKLLRFFPYAGLSVNLFLKNDDVIEKSYIPSYVQTKNFTIFGKRALSWIGYSVGVQY